jgi:hypothetical protein
MKKQVWIDTRLSEECMQHLHSAISEKESGVCDIIVDKDNWFFETTLKRLVERMFYRDWNTYYKYHIEVEEGTPLPKFEMDRFWVNYQKQNEFFPFHNHSSLFSFVVFMKIPTHWREQHALDFGKFRARVASDFMFVWTDKDSENCQFMSFDLSSEDEGRILFFPGWLQHQVYPFYGTEEERVTISGNIRLYDPNNIPKNPRMETALFKSEDLESKKDMLEMLENTVENMKNNLTENKRTSRHGFEMLLKENKTNG